ncbi:nucleoside deaminase [Sphingomicrobium sp. XHP0239]|uniref:nucleoside deaminase n=1 Tax=Sphingomicrobium maritimum TaxID=3133972 RepID=UPI0031CCCE97
MSVFPLPDPMRRALALAEDAAARGEVPVGAVVCAPDGHVVGEGINRMRTDADPTAHAEIVALRAAGRHLETSRLDDCTMWVTLEPCAMCAGAIATARIGRLHFAASDPKGGAVLHGPRVFGQPTCHHRPQVDAGLGEDQAAELLRTFFRDRR